LGSNYSPSYINVAEKVQQLLKLGMNQKTIAKHLKVSAKTVAKATDWAKSD
jgi:transposase